MPEQISFDEAMTIRQRAMEQADYHAAPDWKSEARAALESLIASGIDFTADDIWELCSAETHEPSALGPVIRRVAVEGRIRKTGAYRPSRYARRHRDLTVGRAATHD